MKKKIIKKAMLIMALSFLIPINANAKTYSLPVTITQQKIDSDCCRVIKVKKAKHHKQLVTFQSQNGNKIRLKLDRGFDTFYKNTLYVLTFSTENGEYMNEREVIQLRYVGWISKKEGKAWVKYPKAK